MRYKITFSLFVLLAIAVLPVPAMAGQWYLGGTLERVSFGSELSDMGLKFIFNDVRPLQPFVVAGISSHLLDYGPSTLDIDGAGLFAGVGFEGFINPANSVGLSVKTHWWDGEDIVFSYNARTTSVGIFFTHYFPGF